MTVADPEFCSYECLTISNLKLVLKLGAQITYSYKLLDFLYNDGVSSKM